MQQTEKYKFNLPEGTDIVRIEDLNENIVEIDGILSKVEASVKSKQEKGDYALNTELGRVIDNANNLSDSIDRTNSRVDSLSNQANGIVNNVEKIKKDITDGFERDKDLKVRCVNIESSIEALQGKDSNIDASITAVKEKIQNNKNDITSLSTLHTATRNKIDKVESDAAPVYAKVNKNAGDITSLKSKTAEISNDLNETIDKVKSMDKELNSAESNISSINNRTNSNKTHVLNLLNRADSAESEIAKLKTKDTEISSKANSAYSQAQTNKGSISTLSSAHSGTKSKVDTLAGNISSHNTRITTNLNKANEAKNAASAAMTKANQAFQSVSEGKKKLGAALTDMGVANVPSAGSLPSKNFDWFASSIRSIKTGGKGAKGTISNSFSVSGLSFVPSVICVKQRVEFRKTTTTYRDRFDERDPWLRPDDREVQNIDGKAEGNAINERVIIEPGEYEIVDREVENYHTEEVLYFCKPLISNKILKINNSNNSVSYRSLSSSYSVSSSGFKFGIVPLERVTSGRRPGGYFDRLESPVESVEKNQPMVEKSLENTNEFERIDFRTYTFTEILRTSCKMEYFVYE